MTETPELSSDLEFGQIEALEIPQWFGLGDQYVADPDYDESLASIDPETQGEDESPDTPGAVGDSFITAEPDNPPEVKSP